jgi:hypothetical protein
MSVVRLGRQPPMCISHREGPLIHHHNINDDDDNSQTQYLAAPAAVAVYIKTED